MPIMPLPFVGVLAIHLQVNRMSCKQVKAHDALKKVYSTAMLYLE